MVSKVYSNCFARNYVIDIKIHKLCSSLNFSGPTFWSELNHMWYLNKLQIKTVLLDTNN